MNQERRSYQWIDAVRAFAAIAVLWQHCIERCFGTADLPKGGFFGFVGHSASFGRDAVMVFFVISGFWISHSVHDTLKRNRWSWSSYLVNRLSRLWVVLVPAMLLGGALDFLGRFPLGLSTYHALIIDGPAPVDVTSHLSIFTFFGNLVFLQLIAVPTWGSNGPLWTLACEFWYYICYPAAVLLVRGRWSFLGIGLLMLSIAVGSRTTTPTLLFGCWLLGAVVRAIEISFPSVYAGITNRRILALAIALGIMVAAEGVSRTSFMETHWFIGCYVVATAFAFLLLAALWTEPYFPPFLDWSRRFGASASFSLYAVHLPIVTFMAACATDLLPLESAYARVSVAIGVSIATIFLGYCFAAQTEAHTSRVRKFIKARFVP